MQGLVIVILIYVVYKARSYYLDAQRLKAAITPTEADKNRNSQIQSSVKNSQTVIKYQKQIEDLKKEISANAVKCDQLLHKQPRTRLVKKQIRQLGKKNQKKNIQLQKITQEWTNIEKFAVRYYQKQNK
ncbi:hypothetical protein [Lactobacillus sp. ESL0681]|uniref:hypothetical protein n=1 Tax=Lactobacillus sp. ESL0681 TaxID=2983211 RepID=UPI0023F99C06|nr:hypothetical protein [Lactobacillus sp. ESL0681]WEV41305.1 hypothetical protein OZX59_09250 [Lactobacillus sp. ESL0681]